MNRFQWIYVDDTGRKNKIGIVHFPKNSGHLLIYVNSKITVVDFSIFDSKTYSIFIEGELCEVIVEKKDEQFFYGFEINKEADTPRNQFRKETEKRNLVKTFALLGLFAIAIMAIVWGVNYFLLTSYKEEAAKLTLETAVAVPAQLFQDASLLKYNFVANGNILEGELDAEWTKQAKQFTGFPIENGNEFTVLYAPHNPKIHRLDYQQPSASQIESYKTKAIQQELQYNQQIDSTKASCLVQIAFEQKGLAGLADFYHQKTLPTRNATFNQDSYKRLIRDIPFQKASQEKCW